MAAARDARWAPVYAAIDEYNYRKAATLLEKRELASTALGKVRIRRRPLPVRQSRCNGGDESAATQRELVPG